MKYTEMLNVCKNISSSNASKKVVVVGDYFLKPVPPCTQANPHM